MADRWPDNSTRKLLEECVGQDESGYVRLVLRQALAEKWPDDITTEPPEDRKLPNMLTASEFAGQHSVFGRLVFSLRVREFGPNLNPTQPIPREHIDRAAKIANISPDQIDQTIRSLSQHMGWDITKGSAAPPPE